MHVYIDETITSEVFVQAALVIHDGPSKVAIKRAVRKALLAVKERLAKQNPAWLAELPNGRIQELKGATVRNNDRHTPGLNERPYADIRDAFFRDLATTHCSIGVIYVSADGPVRLTRRGEYKTYGRFLQKLFSTIEVPGHVKQIGITIDSMATARPTMEGGKSFTWRKRRSGQRAQREGDKLKHKSWSQRISAILAHRYPGRRLHRRIWIVPSHLDPCLQAVDVLANFFSRYHRLNRPLPPYRDADCYPLPAGAERPKWNRTRGWFWAYQILLDRTRWMHNPRIRRARDLVQLARHRSQMTRSSVLGAESASPREGGPAS